MHSVKSFNYHSADLAFKNAAEIGTITIRDRDRWIYLGTLTYENDFCVDEFQLIGCDAWLRVQVTPE